VKPVLLDLFCGAGGAGMGYHRAGFEVVGVDIAHQRNYPFEFWQMDVMEWLPRAAWDRAAAIHASPPCQRHSRMGGCRPGLREEYPDLIGAMREFLINTGLPYVIENVTGAPLKDPIKLCGTMFGYELYRHRLFESNVDLTVPPHPRHVKPVSAAGHWEPGTVMSVAGNIAPISLAREVMDIDWCNRAELVQAIPPYYTEFIGKQLRRVC